MVAGLRMHMTGNPVVNVMNNMLNNMLSDLMNTVVIMATWLLGPPTVAVVTWVLNLDMDHLQTLLEGVGLGGLLMNWYWTRQRRLDRLKPRRRVSSSTLATVPPVLPKPPDDTGTGTPPTHPNGC